ncbi:deubiquitinase DESI2-like [Rhagoletis pomonella]|uniref:deubiquitinase DESI2-like n=1 Tax=Rhagoletis pomonella TaxID=28610 RepID=UPI00177ACF5E|nr:deubiquitinase DESI2-like [Rhagoletis pomonella]
MHSNKPLFSKFNFGSCFDTPFTRARYNESTAAATAITTTETATTTTTTSTQSTKPQPRNCVHARLGTFCEPVKLNVYDILKINEYSAYIGLGAFHSGVELYGTEFAYGGHQFPFTGIFEMLPRDHADLGTNFQFRQTVNLGCTQFTCQQVYEIVEELGQKFTGSSYHLINNNCNHFCDYLARFLCGKAIPGWVNRLATISGYVPFLQRILPRDWLTPRTTLRESVTVMENSNSTSYANVINREK